MVRSEGALVTDSKTAKSATALEIIRNLAIEVFPEWTDRFLALTPEAVAALVKGGR